MILYNVTISIENDIHDEFIQWMLTEHIPEVMSTQLFVEYKLLRMLQAEEEAQGLTTYAVQYYLKGLEDFVQYSQHHAPELQAKTRQKYGERVLAFRTLLEVVHP
ncbi:DUF4286 family protein [Eisenibacter elegans]|jgi:hypothetical protein|uniref:DUF4286 family protein n=1 Tax=Eisenibacter elegans TaxID=997 RepID=UPI000416803B|nr:DUF4286 family protein [Eisenibacter elegans]